MEKSELFSGGPVFAKSGGVFAPGTDAVVLADFADVISFALLIIILVVKPTGIFGEQAREKV